MVSSISSSSFAGATDALSPTELYARVSKSLLAQNASVQKLAKGIAADQTKLSGLGQLSSALSDFQAFAQSVNGSGLLTSATAGTPTVLDALTKTGAKPGTYQVDVKQLAQAQQLTSKALSSETAAIGTGASTTIRIELGTTSGSKFAPRTAATLTIDASNNSLDGIAKAFKAAGVDASVVKNGSGFSLQLNGQTGAANSLRVSVGGDAALQKLLAFAPGSSSGLSQGRAAQDAQLSIDGKAVTSASNVVTGQVDGTALSLKTVGKTSVVVAQDNSAIAKNVANFASSYNSLAGKLATLRTGELKSDAAIGEVQDQLALLIKGNSALAKAGVTIGADGLVHIDSKTLAAAVAADPVATAKLFTDSGKGVADQLSSKVSQFLGNTGLVGSETQAAKQDASTLGTQHDALAKVLTARANTLVAQYTQATQGTQGSDISSALPGYTGPTSLFDILA